jgi:hypothetical protein
MSWNDFVKKVTSRKFWLAVIGFVSPLMIALGYGESQIERVAAIIMGGGTLIAYIIGEGLVDASRNNGDNYMIQLPTEEEDGDVEEVQAD